MCLFICCTDALTYTVMVQASMTCACVKCPKGGTATVHMISKTLQFLNTIFAVMLKQISGVFNCNDCCIHPYSAYFGGHPTRCTGWEINESCYIGWPN